MTKIVIFRKQGALIMNGPINYFFELHRIQQREYEAQANRYWRQHLAKQDRLGRSKGRKLALALGGVGVTVVVLVQLLPF